MKCNHSDQILLTANTLVICFTRNSWKYHIKIELLCDCISTRWKELCKIVLLSKTRHVKNTKLQWKFTMCRKCLRASLVGVRKLQWRASSAREESRTALAAAKHVQYAGSGGCAAHDARRSCESHWQCGGAVQVTLAPGLLHLHLSHGHTHHRPTQQQQDTAHVLTSPLQTRPFSTQIVCLISQFGFWKLVKTSWRVILLCYLFSYDVLFSLVTS